MSTAEAVMGPAGLVRRADDQAAVLNADAAAVAAGGTVDIIDEIFGGADKREKFIPVTAQAIMDRLTRPQAWPGNEAQQARKMFRYLNHWRRQSYSAKLLDIERTYEPFSPDSDLLITRKFSDAERAVMQKRLVGQLHDLLQQANYVRIDPAKVDQILTKESHYGLDLHVDLEAFDELAIYYSGATKLTGLRRNLRQLFLRKEEFDVPIFQRLCVVFKLKTEDVRLREIMARDRCERDAAEKIYSRVKGMMAPQIKTEFVYLKLFKNIPRSDLEMIFPNTRIKFRMRDKLKLGATAGGGLATAFGTAAKLIAATNPITLAVGAVGLGGIAFRQVMGFVNQRNKYMVTMAQNLYFHAMADNRGVMTLLAERAAEEDVKEEMLLYSVLAKETVNRRELPDIDVAIEHFMRNTFGVHINFDIEDALGRLIQDGLVTEQPDGNLLTRPPALAASHIDKLWDQLLDDLPDHVAEEGVEFDDEPDRPSA